MCVIPITVECGLEDISTPVEGVDVTSFFFPDHQPCLSLSSRCRTSHNSACLVKGFSRIADPSEGCWFGIKSPTYPEM